MRKVCEFTVPGPPVPWARVRVDTSRRDASGAAAPSFFTATAQRTFKRSVASYAAAAMLQARIAGTHMGRPIGPGIALGLIVRAFLPIPQAFNRADEHAAAAGMLRPTTRPDLDNWIKLPMDALNTVAWLDDSQVVTFDGSGKWYARKPRLEVVVWYVEPAPLPDCL